MNFNKILKSLFGDKSSRDMKPSASGRRSCKSRYKILQVPRRLVSLN